MDDDTRQTSMNFTPIGMARSRVFRWAFLVLRLTLVLTPLGFLWRQHVTNWKTLASDELEVNMLYAGLGFCFLMAAFGLLPLITRMLLSTMGYRLSYSAAYRAFFLSQVAKYLPGGVWVVPYRAGILKQYGITLISATAATLIEMVLLIMAGTLVFVPYVLFSPIPTTASHLIPVIFFTAVLLLCCLHPVIFRRFLTFLFKRTRYGQSLRNIQVSGIAKILLVNVFFWLLAGGAFFLIISSVRRVPLNLILVSISAFSMAWVIGVIAFVTPGGLGVREAALAGLLLPFLPASIAALIALVSRVLWTLAEILSLAIAGLFVKGPSLIKEAGFPKR